MKKTFLVEITFDDSEFDLNRITHEFVQEVLEKYIGGKGVTISVVNKAPVDVSEDEKTRATEIAATLYRNEIPGTDEEVWGVITTSIYPFDEWYEGGKEFESELKQEFGDLEYDALITKSINEQIKKDIARIIVWNGKVWVLIF